MSYSIGVLNSIRANASEEYQNRIPEATQTNISTIGNALATYTLLYNEFCDALVNKIGKTILEQKLFKNPLARFKSGTVNTQQDVEEIFMEMAKAEGAYDPDGSNPLGRRENPDVQVVYHRLNRRDKYVISIGDLDFLRVFRSTATLDSFISGLINSVYSGANYDEWLAMKETLTASGPVCKCMVTPVTNEATAKAFVKSVRKVTMDMSFMSQNHNEAGVMTKSEPGNLVMFINKDLLADIDVEVLAKAFNMGKTDIQTEIIPMDNFGTVESQPYAILCDKDYFRIFDTLSHMEPQRNADGLFTNYFYHVHQILSASPFKNCMWFMPQSGT